MLALPWTTSSCENGSTKFSWKAYSKLNVRTLWCQRRWTGSVEMYSSVSCIQPMFHLRLKPSPPMYGGRVTCGQAVDSSATVNTPGHSVWTTSFMRCRKEIASRFSRPPYWFGTHWPGSRE